MSEKPLHVRVAEALGWTACENGWVFSERRWCGTAPDRQGGFDGFGRREIPRFDTNWSATGPLIERLGIAIEHSPAFTLPAQWNEGRLVDDAKVVGAAWFARRDGLEEMAGAPLPAICLLLLSLKEAGKLPL